jgi:hypothetical protein
MSFLDATPVDDSDVAASDDGTERGRALSVSDRSTVSAYEVTAIKVDQVLENLPSFQNTVEYILKDVQNLPRDPGVLQEQLSDEQTALSHSSLPKRKLFISHLPDFGIEQGVDSFVSASNLRKALLRHYNTKEYQEHNEREGGKLDDVISLINLGRLGLLLPKWFIPADVADYSTELCQIDIEFPAQFVKSWTPKDKPVFGRSQLLTETFNLALELRTQVAIIRLLENSQKPSPQDPGYCFRLSFYNSPEDDDDNEDEFDLIANGLRPWGTSAFAKLDSYHTRVIQERIDAIDAYLPSEGFDGNEHYMDDLRSSYQWDDFVLLALDWVRKRHKELRQHIRSSGGVESIVKLIQEVPEPTLFVQELPNPVHGQQGLSGESRHLSPNSAAPPSAQNGPEDIMRFSKQSSRFSREPALGHRSEVSPMVSPMVSPGSTRHTKAFQTWTQEPQPPKRRKFNEPQDDAGVISEIGDDDDDVRSTQGLTRRPRVNKPSTLTASRVATNIESSLPTQPDAIRSRSPPNQPATSNTRTDWEVDTPADTPADTEQKLELFEREGLQYLQRYKPKDYERYLKLAQAKTSERNFWTPCETGALIYYMKMSPQVEGKPFSWASIVAKDKSEYNVLKARTDTTKLKDKAVEMKANMLLGGTAEGDLPARFNEIRLKPVHLQRLDKAGITYDGPRYGSK